MQVCFKWLSFLITEMKKKNTKKNNTHFHTTNEHQKSIFFFFFKNNKFSIRETYLQRYRKRANYTGRTAAPSMSCAVTILSDSSPRKFPRKAVNERKTRYIHLLPFQWIIFYVDAYGPYLKYSTRRVLVARHIDNISGGYLVWSKSSMFPFWPVCNWMYLLHRTKITKHNNFTWSHTRECGTWCLVRSQLYCIY